MTTQPIEDRARRDVVFTFSFETLQVARRRGFERPPDRLLLALQDDPRVRRLAIVDTPRHFAGLLQSRPHDMELGSGHLHLRPARLARHDPTSIDRLARRYRHYDAWLRRRVESAGFVNPWVVTTSPLVAGFADLSWAWDVCFFARDDWCSFEPHRAYWPAYEAAYAQIRRRGYVVGAVSPLILERIRPTGPQTVVMNGIEPREWASPSAPPDWFSRLPRPRLLYLGSLDRRVDIPALRRLADHFATGTLVLLGNLNDPNPFRDLIARPNVHHAVAEQRSEVAAVTKAADVCLLVHQDTRLTRAMSPLKLFEYLAGGAPTVATRLPGTTGVDPRVHLVETSDAWPDAVEAALRQGRASEPERQAFVAANGWPRRMAPLLDLVLGS